MKEQRQHERKSYKKTVFYFITTHDLKRLKMLNLKGEGIDISDGGMGIQTGYPVEPGHVIKFDSCVGCKVGHVMWSARINSTIYRVGIKFK